MEILYNIMTFGMTSSIISIPMRKYSFHKVIFTKILTKWLLCVRITALYEKGGIYMYNERENSFSIRDIILQLLFIVLFVLVLVWLFPTKGDMQKSLKGVKVDADLSGLETQLEVLTNRIFAENLETMKEAAISYYTDERLPKKVGESKELTLKEMINEKLLIEFKDSKGKSCNMTESYVKITKNDNEYLLKVNLKCSDDEGYILVHLGCYTYCKSAVCEKQPTTTPTTTPTVTPTPKPNPTPNPNPTPDPKPNPTPVKTYMYKYMKKTNDTYSAWSSWSKWSTTKVTETNLRDVETRTTSQNIQEKVLIGYNVKTYLDKSKPIYEDVKVLIDTVQVKTGCKTWGTETVGTGEYRGEWVNAGTVKLATVPADTSTTKYIYNYSATASCGDCASQNLTVYTVQKYKTYEIKTTKEVCKEYNYKTEEVYGTSKKVVGYETYQIKEPVYGYRTKTVTTKEYRYRTRTFIPGTVTYKWSYSSNDKTLISQGYTYTGVKKEV